MVNRRQKSKAFTAIEFAVVLLIAMLVFITITPAMMKMVDITKSKTTTDEIEDIQFDIDKFFKDNGRFPDSLEEVFGETPLDPWGNPYLYINHINMKGKGQMRKDKNLVPINSDYDLYSAGPDGESASPLTAALSQDDIIRGRNGAFIGYAIDY